MSSNSERPPEVPVVCRECGTETEIPLSELAESIERHNRTLHDGEEVAEVDPEIADHLADIVAEEMGLL